MTLILFAAGATDAAGRLRRLPPGAPRHRRRAADRRSEITAAARALISEVGSDQVTVAAIAVRAGISRGGLTRYFPTKRALWQAVSLAGRIEDAGVPRPRAGMSDDRPTDERVRARGGAKERAGPLP